MTTNATSKKQPKRLKYEEGDVFAVPLQQGGFVLGVVARIDRSFGFIGYFYPTVWSTIPETTEGLELSPEQAKWVKQVGHRGIKEGRWKIIGRVPGWSRETWPNPEFFRSPWPGAHCKLKYHDDQHWKDLYLIRIRPEEATDLPEDGSMHHMGFETYLSEELRPKMYKEGDVVAVPLGIGGYILMLITRTNESRYFIGYFFGPHICSIPKTTRGLKIKSREVIWIRKVFHDGIREGIWTIIGALPGWNRDEWPLPTFIQRNADKWTLKNSYSDQNFLREGSIEFSETEIPLRFPAMYPDRFRPEAVALDGLPEDGVSHAQDVERYLERRFSTSSIGGQMASESNN